MVKYPAAIDTVIELPIVIDGYTEVSAQYINNLRNTIVAIESELGVKPSGIYATVRSRITALEIAVANITGGGGGLFGGDLVSATGTTQKVIGLQGRPLSASVPSVNQTYIWDGLEWVPGTVSNFTAAGDLSGTEASQTVVGLRNVPVINEVPTDGYLLTYDQGGGGWRPLPAPIGFSAGGDLSGTASNQTVIRLQNRDISVAAPSVNDALMWNGSTWAPSSVVIAVNRHAIEVMLVAGVFSHGDTTFKRVGGRSIDITQYPATLNGLTRRVDFVADIQKTPAATSAEIQLFDITHNVLVTGTNLTSSNNSTTKVFINNLTVGSSNGNIRSDIESQYEVQLRMNGGSEIDQVYCTNARLIITYS